MLQRATEGRDHDVQSLMESYMSRQFVRPKPRPEASETPRDNLVTASTASTGLQVTKTALSPVKVTRFSGKKARLLLHFL